MGETIQVIADTFQKILCQRAGSTIAAEVNPLQPADTGALSSKTSSVSSFKSPRALNLLLESEVLGMSFSLMWDYLDVAYWT